VYFWVVGLLYLQHSFDCAVELVVNTWVENPYWQYFKGESYLQTRCPIDPSSLMLWVKCQLVSRRLGQAL
jgi:IS5 family transposase